MNIQRWLKSPEHQKRLEKWWIPIMVMWEIIKTLAIKKTFSKYGVSTWVYFALVMTIAIPYAHTTAKLLFNIIEKKWKTALLYGLAAMVLHFAPDVYILANAKEVPKHIYDGFIFVVAIFTFFGVQGIVMAIRDHRKNSKS